MNVDQKHKKCSVPVTDVTKTDRIYRRPGVDLKLIPDDQVDEQIFVKELIKEQVDKTDSVPVAEQIYGTKLCKNDDSSKTDIKANINVRNNGGSQLFIERKKLYVTYSITITYLGTSTYFYFFFKCIYFLQTRPCSSALLFIYA